MSSYYVVEDRNKPTALLIAAFIFFFVTYFYLTCRRIFSTYGQEYINRSEYRDRKKKTVYFRNKVCLANYLDTIHQESVLEVLLKHVTSFWKLNGFLNARDFRVIGNSSFIAIFIIIILIDIAFKSNPSIHFIIVQIASYIWLVILFTALVKRFHSVGLSFIVPTILVVVLFVVPFLVFYFGGHNVSYTQDVVKHGVHNTVYHTKQIYHDLHYSIQSSSMISLFGNLIIGSFIPSIYYNNKYIYKEYVDLIKQLLESEDINDIIEAENLIFLGRPEQLVKDLPVFEFSPSFTTRNPGELEEHAEARRIYAFLYYKALIEYCSTSNFEFKEDNSAGFTKENSDTVFTKVKAYYDSESEFVDPNTSTDDIKDQRNFENEKTAKKSKDESQD